MGELIIEYTFGLGVWAWFTAGLIGTVIAMISLYALSGHNFSLREVSVSGILVFTTCVLFGWVTASMFLSLIVMYLVAEMWKKLIDAKFWTYKPFDNK